MIADLTYVACPYTHELEGVREKRFRSVNRFCAALMSKGEYVYSPISHTHPIAMAGRLPTSWDFWEMYDQIMLSKCDRVYVLCLEGWERSRGVQAEIKIAEQLNLVVYYFNDQGEQIK